jgi:hypothetical protein
MIAIRVRGVLEFFVRSRIRNLSHKIIVCLRNIFDDYYKLLLEMNAILF